MIEPGADRYRFVAVFENAFDRIAKNRQHELLLGFQISRPAKNLAVLLGRDHIPFKKLAGTFHILASSSEAVPVGREVTPPASRRLTAIRTTFHAASDTQIFQTNTKRSGGPMSELG